jgi:hypothetical protein
MRRNEEGEKGRNEGMRRGKMVKCGRGGEREE